MITINDIANMAGVSVATVSHVVNKTRYVSPQLVKKVEIVINSLDEVPNFIKKNQTKKEKKLKLIPVYVPDFEDPFYTLVLEKIMNKIEHIENTIIFPVKYNNLNDEVKLISSNFPNNIYGQVALLDKQYSETLSYKFTKAPTIFINKKKYSDVNHHFIISDHERQAYTATNHLIKNGHNKIGFIDRSNKDGNDNSSLLGYKEALSSHDINIDSQYIYVEALDKDILDTFLKKILLNENAPSALITSSASLMQVLDFIKRHNIDCPKDISLVSLQDEDWLKYSSPSITAINNNIDSIIELVLNFIERIDDTTEEDPLNFKIEDKLIIRSSTGGIGRGPFGEKAAPISSLELTKDEISIISSQRRTAVISFHYTGASWMALHEKGIREVFKQLNIDLIGITDAYFDPHLQNKQLESLLSLDPDIFIAIPTDNDKTSHMFKKIADSDTKLILITSVPTGLSVSDYVTVVSVNEHYHGRLVASGLGDSLRSHNKKNIAFLYHNSNFYATNQRDNSARQMLTEEYPDLKIIVEESFIEEKQLYTITKDLLKKYPNIEGIYITWEGPAKEVLNALQDLGREDIIISTADLDYSLALDMAKDGNVKSISAQQPYEQGRAIALASAKAILNASVPTFIGIEPIKVDRNNLLSSWKSIFKEAPPQELQEILSK